ncbi:MAG TPA: PAS domain S-box protein, partial [Chroococcales cyanobacterium]
MSELLQTLLASRGFIPHGYCYLWTPELVWLHVLSDSLIALADYSIPIVLIYFVRKRPDVPFNWMFLLFGTFIVAYGTSHLMEVWTLWHPTYWLSGFIKVITALTSLATAAWLVPLIPQALALPSPAQLETVNIALRNELAQRQAVEKALQKANEHLEIRVRERTEELTKSNTLLQAEIAERKRQAEVINRREQEFKALVENAPDIIARFDRDLRHVYVNPAIEQVTGLSREAFIGKTNRDLGMPEELISFWDSAIRKVFETAQEEIVEFPFPTPNGINYYQVRIVPELALDGSVESAVGITRDISNAYRELLLRQQREEELRLLQTITQSISEAPNFDLALGVALSNVCEVTDWDFGETWIPNSQAQILELSPAWYSSTESLDRFRRYSEALTFPINTGIPGRVWASKQPEWIQDVSLQPDSVFLRTEMAQESGLKAALGVPLIADEQVLAVFVFFKFEPSKEDKRLVELVVSVANQLGLVIRRKQAENALQQINAELELRVNQRTAELIQTNEQL